MKNLKEFKDLNELNKFLTANNDCALAKKVNNQIVVMSMEKYNKKELSY